MGSSALPCSTAFGQFEVQRASWSLQQRGRQRACCCAMRVSTDIKRWDALAFHRCRTNCLRFGSYCMSNNLVSDKEPVTPCKNSPPNSKVYWSPGINVVEDKKFEGFCSKLQESKQKGEDERWWIETAQTEDIKILKNWQIKLTTWKIVQRRNIRLLWLPTNRRGWGIFFTVDYDGAGSG